MSDSTGLGTLPFDEVIALVEQIECGVPWREAVATLPLPTLSSKRHWFSNPAKASFYLSLPVPTRGLAIDVGAGSGVIAGELGRHFTRAIAVEQDERWCRFMAHRFRQDGLPVDVINGSAFRLPQDVADVDLAVVNGVLEWVAFGESPEARAGSPRDVQTRFLRTIWSVLRPGGRIGIAIENRLNFDYFRGDSPHGEPPYVAVLPRAIAGAVNRRQRGTDYRTWIYGARGYTRLLQDAGFRGVQILAALPTYHQPEQAVALDRADVIRSYMLNGSRVRRFACETLAAAGLLGYAVHSFYITAERPGK